MTLERGRLDALIAAAEELMTKATGGQAACVLTRSGIAAPAAKYAEGRWAALRDLRNRLRRDASDPIVALSVLHGEWREDLESRTASGAGPDWLAYLNGGVDALAEVAAELSDRQGSGPTGPDP